MNDIYIDNRECVVLKKNKDKVFELLANEGVDVITTDREWRGEWTYISYCNVLKNNKLADSIGDLTVHVFKTLDKGRCSYENGKLQEVIKLLKKGAKIRPLVFA